MYTKLKKRVKFCNKIKYKSHLTLLEDPVGLVKTTHIRSIYVFKIIHAKFNTSINIVPTPNVINQIHARVTKALGLPGPRPR